MTTPLNVAPNGDNRYKQTSVIASLSNRRPVGVELRIGILAIPGQGYFRLNYTVIGRNWLSDTGTESNRERVPPQTIESLLDSFRNEPPIGYNYAQSQRALTILYQRVEESDHENSARTIRNSIDRTRYN